MKMPTGSLISYFSSLVKEHGGINLAQGIPGFNPPPELIQSLHDVADDSFHQYPPGIGNFALREQILRHYSAKASLTNDHLLILQGATEALSLIFFYVMRLHKSPFTTLSFTPPYESYQQLPLQFGYPFIEVDPTEQGRIPLDKVEAYIDNENVQLIFLASPGNPHGLVFPQNDVDDLVELCSRKKCFLVFDSVYRTLYFGQEPYVPLHKLNPYLFVVDGFSKWFSITGWRVGYLFHHESHTATLRSLHDYTGLCTNAVLQEALARFVATTDFGKLYSEKLRHDMHKNEQFAYDKLNDLGFFPRKADGGYFIWTQLPERFNDGFEFAYNLFEKSRVSIVPGIHFSPNAGKYVRFNIARPMHELSEGLDRLENFLREN